MSPCPTGSAFVLLKSFPICKPRRGGNAPTRPLKCHNLSVLKPDVKTKYCNENCMSHAQSLLLVWTSQALSSEHRNALLSCFHLSRTFISLQSRVLAVSCQFEKMGSVFLFYVLKHQNLDPSWCPFSSQ